MKKVLLFMTALVLILCAACPALAVSASITENCLAADAGGAIETYATEIKSKLQPLYLPVTLHFNNGLGEYETLRRYVQFAVIAYRYAVQVDDSGRYLAAYFLQDDDAKIESVSVFALDASGQTTIEKKVSPTMWFKPEGFTYSGYIGGGLINITYNSDIYFDVHMNVEKTEQAAAQRAFLVYISPDDHDAM